MLTVFLRVSSTIIIVLVNGKSFFASFVNKDERHTSFEPVGNVLPSCKCFLRRRYVRSPWLLTSFFTAYTGSQIYYWTETSPLKRCVHCFSAKEKYFGISFEVFFVYFCLFANYLDSQGRTLDNPETFLSDNEMSVTLTLFLAYICCV